MFLAETSITCAIRDALSEREVSSFHHTPEHHVGVESDNLRFLCGCEEPVYTDTIGIVAQSHQLAQK
jgi:hypothetical protein